MTEDARGGVTVLSGGHPLADVLAYGPAWGARLASLTARREGEAGSELAAVLVRRAQTDRVWLAYRRPATAASGSFAPDDVVGWACAYGSLVGGSPVPRLGVYVDPAWRRRGVGGRLVEAAVRWAGSPAGLRAAPRDETGARLYARHGVPLLGAPPPAPAAPPPDRVLCAGCGKEGTLVAWQPGGWSAPPPGWLARAGALGLAHACSTACARRADDARDAALRLGGRALGALLSALFGGGAAAPGPALPAPRAPRGLARTSGRGGGRRGRP